MLEPHARAIQCFTKKSQGRKTAWASSGARGRVWACILSLWVGSGEGGVGWIVRRGWKSKYVVFNVLNEETPRWSIAFSERWAILTLR